MDPDDSQVTDFQDRFYFSLSQLSNAFGPARETIGKRLQLAGINAVKRRAGHPVYHIGEAAKAILAGEQASFEGIDNPDGLPPKERLDWYRSENERTKLEREQGALVPRETHERIVAELVKLILQPLETLPDSLERQCRLEPEAIAAVDREVDRVREALAQRLESYELL